MKDNIDHILNAAEQPDTVIESLAADREALELSALMRKTADALVSPPDPDIEAEWTQFRQEHPVIKRSRIKTLLYRRPAGRSAAAAICAIVSLAVVAATIGTGYFRKVVSTDDNASPVETVDEAAAHASVSATDFPAAVTSDSVTPETVTFKDDRLDSILSCIGRHYGCGVAFVNSEAGALRLYFSWDRNQSLDEVVTQLNSFGRIDMKLVDNTITVE